MGKLRRSVRRLGSQRSSRRDLHRIGSPNVRIVSACCCRMRNIQVGRHLLVFTTSCRRLSRANGLFCLRGSGCGTGYYVLGGCSSVLRTGIPHGGVCALGGKLHSVCVGGCRCRLVYCRGYPPPPPRPRPRSFKTGCGSITRTLSEIRGS